MLSTLVRFTRNVSTAVPNILERAFSEEVLNEKHPIVWKKQGHVFTANLKNGVTAELSPGIEDGNTRVYLSKSGFRSIVREFPKEADWMKNWSIAQTNNVGTVRRRLD